MAPAAVATAKKKAFMVAAADAVAYAAAEAAAEESAAEVAAEVAEAADRGFRGASKLVKVYPEEDGHYGKRLR